MDASRKIGREGIIVLITVRTITSLVVVALIATYTKLLPEATLNRHNLVF